MGIAVDNAPCRATVSATEYGQRGIGCTKGGKPDAPAFLPIVTSFKGLGMSSLVRRQNNNPLFAPFHWPDAFLILQIPDNQCEGRYDEFQRPPSKAKHRPSVVRHMIEEDVCPLTAKRIDNVRNCIPGRVSTAMTLNPLDDEVVRPRRKRATGESFVFRNIKFNIIDPRCNGQSDPVKDMKKFWRPKSVDDIHVHNSCDVEYLISVEGRSAASPRGAGGLKSATTHFGFPVLFRRPVGDIVGRHTSRWWARQNKKAASYLSDTAFNLIQIRTRRCA